MIDIKDVRPNEAILWNRAPTDSDISDYLLWIDTSHDKWVLYINRGHYWEKK